MKLVVTGSLGNISAPLTQELLQQGHTVTVISSKPDKRRAIEALGAAAAIGTIEDVRFLTATFNGADAVYCMLPPFNYFDPAIDVMVEARKLTTAYAEAIRQSGVKRVIHLSSVGAHLAEGNGVLAFHHLAERILRELPADVSITHMRPVGFYTNLFSYMDMIRGEGLLGRFLTLRYSGLLAAITGKTGVIAANFGAEDKTPWVSPRDIAAAVAEELTTPFAGRNVRYVASDELTCNQVASILGQAIGKPYLQWALMSDKQMQSGLEMFKVPKARAVGIVEMNAAIHSGLIDEDYYRHRPVLGKVKLADFAPEFAAVYHKR
ncbi:NAD(P)H-binding protein [Hymenobacter sp. GOD-10R]|uniref:NAD(P)H-binding protein n=1 Tax=Hymenobacter sp. GOD-10R TaxID=3093922 RepID=UPI002D766376|nr:NAD(P)H-binding protein [Hymenobacter sp. GOD-10R]WRQ26892.1 NAD(P)H-binding protein [Hymenobacter sp. GOD-10R]